MGRAQLGSLQTLWLGGNWTECWAHECISCTQAVCAALILGRAASLVSLDLCNGLMPEGGITVCAMLEDLHPPLTELDLSDSRFGGGEAPRMPHTVHCATVHCARALV